MATLARESPHIVALFKADTISRAAGGFLFFAGDASPTAALGLSGGWGGILPGGLLGCKDGKP